MGPFKTHCCFDCLCAIITKLPLLYGTLQDSKLFACLLCVIATKLLSTTMMTLWGQCFHMWSMLQITKDKVNQGVQIYDPSERKGKGREGKGKGSNKPI